MNMKIFFDELRSHLFKGKLSQGQVDNINYILSAWNIYRPKSDPRWISYSLGTVYRECGADMEPIREYGKGRGKSYGRPKGPYKQTYYGRGYVQETWYDNYVYADKELHKLGILSASESLVKNPDLALEPRVAAPILVIGMCEGWFTHRKLSDYFAGTRSDWVDARRIINGTDHAALVASYGMIFYHAMQKTGVS